MSSRGQAHNRFAVLRERVQALVSQFAELQDLRTRVMRAEQRRIGRRRSARGRAAIKAKLGRGRKYRVT